MKTTQWLAGIFLGFILSAAPTWAFDLKRDSYTLTLPEGAHIDNSYSAEDPDHYTAVDLPGDNLLIMIVIDEKSELTTAAQTMQSTLSNETGLTEHTPSDTFAAVKGEGVRMRSSDAKDEHVIDMGSFSSQSKGYLMVYGFKKGQEKAAAKTLQDILRAMRLQEGNQ